MQIRQPWWCNIFWSSLQLYDKKCFGICKCQKELGLLKNLLRYFALFSGVVYIFCLQNRSLGLISFFGRAIKRHFFGGEKELEPVFCTKYNNKETGIKKWWANIWKNVGQQKEVFKIATVRQLVFFGLAKFAKNTDPLCEKNFFVRTFFSKCLFGDFRASFRLSFLVSPPSS